MLSISNPLKKPILLGVLLSLAGVLLAVVAIRQQQASALGGTAGDINTFAGNGSGTFGGDGGAATSASLNLPGGLVVNSFNSDSLIIADQFNCRVREVSGGTINTIAGDGNCGFLGDGGSATSARLGLPGDVALDSSGGLYIADYSNCRIRKVSSGTITTVAGNGSCGYSGDGGAATSAAINNPYAVAVDSSDNFYIGGADCVVRKVDTLGIISTFAGTGACGFSGDTGPATSATVANTFGLAVDASDNVYISDSGNCRVRMVDTLGTITTVAGNGTCNGTSSGDSGAATSAAIYKPFDVGFDASGNMYIAERENCHIRKVSGGTISTIAGTTCGFGGDGGPATAANLNGPFAVAVDAIGDVFIADTQSHRIRVVYGTKAGPTPTETATATPCPDLDDDTICDAVDTDTDGDGCLNVDEQQTAIGSEEDGGRRNYLDPYDYFNPTGDGENRIDDVLATVLAYFDDDDDGSPGRPPYEPGYNPATDRDNDPASPNAWNTGAPDGIQRVQDIVHALNSYFHDCA